MRGLLVGQRIGGELVYRGTVEFGVSGAMFRELPGSPLVRTTSPFIDLVRRLGDNPPFWDKRWSSGLDPLNDPLRVAQ